MDTAKNFKLPKPSNISKHEIHDLAGKMSEMIGINPGDSLDPIVKKFGGKILIQSSDKWFSGDAIHVKGQGDFEIFLAEFTGPLRDRFTIAHELAHYVLHSKLGKICPMRVGRGDSNRVEWEANWFAAGFLMPYKIFNKEYKNNRDIHSLAAKFMVSPQAISIRIETLNNEHF